ncbi:hypothetical protein SNE40_019660 [Patella caerulea]|uniref:Uncharacterized protein n=1 Tax=Patella caerulea TaxID=87958 RepID=A0AAN8PAQ6_PATCE
MAKVGFSFTGSPDRIQCVFCNCILKNWQDVDIPMIEHRKHFPNCPFVCGHQVGNIPLDIRSHVSISYNERLGASHSHGTGATNQFTPVSGIHTERPRHPNYGTGVTRIASSTVRPSGASQTPQQMFPGRPYCLPQVTVEASVQRFHNLYNVSAFKTKTVFKCYKFNKLLQCCN